MFNVRILETLSKNVTMLSTNNTVAEGIFESGSAKADWKKLFNSVRKVDVVIKLLGEL